MKTVKDLLKQSDQLAGNTQVKLQLHVPLKKVRQYANRLAALGVVNVKIEAGFTRAAKKAHSKTSTKKPVKTAAKRKKPVAMRPPKATVKKTTKPKGPAKPAKAAAVTKSAVLAALRANHRTPQAIAGAMKANPVQVTKALSRYTQQGIIVRTKPGLYALKK